jgi:hypothetical protein
MVLGGWAWMTRQHRSSTMPGRDIAMQALAECLPRADDLPDRLQQMTEKAESAPRH